jgi:molybdenum cofactor synthesis domain-containing protein
MANGRIVALCTSEKTGMRKLPVEAADFEAGLGIAGDAHFGPGHRQVSLLAEEEVEVLKARLPDLDPGAFAENVLTAGVDLARLGLGSRLRLGRDAVLSVTQIGKTCHSRCAVYHQTGDCIMPRVGLFCRVLAGGRAAPGDPITVEKTVGREVFQAVVLTMSDRCLRGEATDTAGPAVADLLTRTGLHVYETAILPDERAELGERLRHYSAGHSIDLVLAVGGTGFAPRDVTPEAVRDVAERLTPGLDEAMRAASLARTPHAMLSRAVSGIRGSTLIVSLPGSERAAIENLQAVLPALAHGLAKLRGDPSDCGR